MNESLFNQGVELMLFGMGTVFVFLTLLVALTTLMSAFISRYLPLAVLVQEERLTQASPGQVVTDKRLVAAISAAIHQHKKK